MNLVPDRVAAMRSMAQDQEQKASPFPTSAKAWYQNPVQETGGFCQWWGSKNPAEYKCQNPKQTPSPDRQSTQAGWQETPSNKSWLLKPCYDEDTHSCGCSGHCAHHHLPSGEHCCCRRKNSNFCLFHFYPQLFFQMLRHWLNVENQQAYEVDVPVMNDTIHDDGDITVESRKVGSVNHPDDHQFDEWCQMTWVRWVFRC